MTINIFPIHIGPYEAKVLCKEYGIEEFKSLTFFGKVNFDYSASILEDGSVEISAYYNSNDGFASYCGTVFFKKIIYPYTTTEINTFINLAKNILAEEEYERRLRSKRNKDIATIRNKMFGPSTDNIS